MPAAKHNLTIEQGATFHRIVRWTLSAEGAPIDLTGYTARMQIRVRANAQRDMATLDTANGGIIIDPVAGQLTLQMPASATQRLQAGSAVYDLQVQSPGGFVTKLLTGTVRVVEGVTRA